jgi:hypothetical protein
MTDERAAGKILQAECFEVQDFLGGGVAGKQDLEAAVEAKTIHDIGTDAAACGVLGFEEADIRSGCFHAYGTTETGKACSYNDCVKH